MTTFDLIAMLAKIGIIVGIALQVVPVMVWFERRGAAWIQLRVGPNRVGPFGLLQSLADVLKFFAKEDFVPDNVNKFYYLMAPMIGLVFPLAAFVAIPFGDYMIIGGDKVIMQIADIDTGVLFLLAFAGLEVYPIILAGWASNNKYSVLGALRGSSQIVSYEIAMALSLVSMMMVYGTWNPQEMVAYQTQTFLGGMLPMWGCFLNPVAALIFFVCIFAETNRLPFDLAEGEAEIIAGYHLEYGAIKFAMFFMAEYVAMLMASAFFATLFLGGYALFPGMAWVSGLIAEQMQFTQVGAHNLLEVFKFISLATKIGVIMIIFVWVRWSFPRFRFDQLMDLGWKIMFPLALVNLVFVALIMAWMA